MLPVKRSQPVESVLQRLVCIKQYLTCVISLKPGDMVDVTEKRNTAVFIGSLIMDQIRVLKQDNTFTKLSMLLAALYFFLEKDFVQLSDQEDVKRSAIDQLLSILQLI